MNYNENIGKIISEHRKKLNMSQDMLAKKLFVTRQAISNWETGKTYPDISVIFNLCKILKIDIKKIIELDDNIKIENIIEIEKKKTNRRNLIWLSVIVVLFLSIIISLVIVINRNYFVLYNVYLDSDEFALNNSLIVKSKIKNYFQFGTLVSKLNDSNENHNYNIKLYKKDGDKKKIIFSGVYKDNLVISEKYGYEEYFSDLYTDLNNLYIEISYIVDNVEHIYEYKLRVEENFKSDSLIYLPSKSIGEGSDYLKEDNYDIDRIIKQGYNYDENTNSFVKNIDNVTLVYNPEANFLSYKKANEVNVIIFDYFANQGRIKLTLYNLENMHSETKNFTLDSYESDYQDDIQFLQNEYNLLS